jgi:hypothetical protein
MSSNKLTKIAYDVYLGLVVIVVSLGCLALWIAIGILILAFLGASIYSDFRYGQTVFWKTFCDMICDGRVILIGSALGCVSGWVLQKAMYVRRVK